MNQPPARFPRRRLATFFLGRRGAVLPVLWVAVVATLLAPSWATGSALAQDELSRDELPAQPPVPHDEIEIFELHEARAGQTGYGLSVFQGREPQRFEVEVIGVMEDSSGLGDAILAHLKGQGLEESGVLGGMSGSPVYIEGRLAGAVAFSWNFSRGAIAGITPIRDMRRLRVEPVAEVPAGEMARSDASVSSSISTTTREGAVPVPSLDDLLHRRFDQDLLQQHLAALRPPTVRGGGGPEAATSNVQWLASGFSDGGRQLLRSALGPVTFGAPIQERTSGAGLLERGTLLDRGGDDGVSGLPSARPNAPDLTALYEPDFTDVAKPGGAVMAALVFGDLKLAAAGTVTDVQGNDVVAFGHPFLGAGPVRLPMASADIVTTVSSIFSSFKVSNIGRLVGTVWQDRSAGIYGRLGEAPPILPLTVRLHPSAGPGADSAEVYQMYLAEARDITPALLGTAAVSILDVASPRLGAGSVDLRARFQIAGHDELIVEQSFDAPQAGVQAIITTLSYAAFLMQTPQAPLDLEAIELDFTLHPRRRLQTLVDAHPLRTVVKPGERLPVFLELESYTGGRQRRTVEVPLPEHLDDGTYVLLVADGASADALRLAVEPQDPTSIDDSLAMLRGFHSNREVHVLGLVPDRGLVLGGQALPRVPASMQTVWGQAPPGSTQPLNLALVDETSWTWDEPVAGLVRIDLTVRRGTGRR